MEKEKPKLLKALSALLRPAIVKPVCKLCLQEFYPQGFSNFFSNPYICEKCRRSFKPIYHSFSLEGTKIYAIYEYLSPLNRYIFQYKECLDIELAPIFLSGMRTILHLKYFFSHIIYMPSSAANRKRRGFNPLELMFQGLNLPVIDGFLYKKDDIDQKLLNGKERREHLNFIGRNPQIDIRGKNILLIDDVICTGTSILQAIKMLKIGEPCRIQVLVLAENK